MSAVDLSSFAGLTAMVLLTLNVLLGMLVTTNYNPRTHWPRRKIPIFKIHNWTAYVAMSAVALHPVILLFSSTARFGIGDVLLPLDSPGQQLYNNLGAVAFYSITLVVMTSYLRPRLGYRPWRKLHWIAYFAAAVLLVHGLLIDPNLKNQPPDLLDGEKVLVEGCFAAIVAATILRARYGREKQRWRAAQNKGERVA
jgi:DMSO/TMAO reductase YedYZ heme-binding membrane subunit